MSIIYCHEHDRYYDSDIEDCCGGKICSNWGDRQMCDECDFEKKEARADLEGKYQENTKIED
jgi:hypothetical protein